MKPKRTPSEILDDIIETLALFGEQEDISEIIRQKKAKLLSELESYYVKTPTKYALQWRDKYFEAIKNVLSDEELKKVLPKLSLNTPNNDYQYGYSDGAKKFLDLTFKALQSRLPKPNGVCPDCNGNGYTAEHDPTDPHENGCSGSCPIQVQCEKCMGTGRVPRGLGVEEIIVEIDNSLARTIKKENKGLMDMHTTVWIRAIAQAIYDAQKGKAR